MEACSDPSIISKPNDRVLLHIQEEVNPSLFLPLFLLVCIVVKQLAWIFLKYVVSAIYFVSYFPFFIPVRSVVQLTRIITHSHHMKYRET